MRTERKYERQKKKIVERKREKEKEHCERNTSF